MTILKNNLIISFFLIILGINSLVAQNQFLWPLPKGTGTVILKPGNTLNPITKEPIFNSGYFISATYNTPVYAVDDGIISSNCPYTIVSPDLTFMCSSGDLETFRTQSFKFKKRLYYKEENLMGSLVLKLKDGSSVCYDGLIKGDTTKKSGHQVKRGDIIGYVGYINVISKEPCIHLTLGKANGTVGDIGIPLLGEDNHFDKLIKKEKLPETLDVKSLNEAYDIFVASLKEGHPSLYDKTSKVEFDSLFDETRQQLNKPMSIQEFRSVLMRVVAKIGCSHTYVHYLMPVDEIYVFPLWVSWVEGKCIVVGDKSGKNIIPKGSEIKTIDGIPINDIIASLKKVMFNDIQTDEWKENQLSKPNCFEYYFKYAFKGKINQQYTFGIIKPDAKQQDVIVKSLFKTAIPKNQVPPKIISDQEPKISFKRLDKNIAYLSIQTCIINDTTKEMICLFIDSLNNEGIKNLVVDLRYNLGGEEMSVFTNIFNKKPINDTTFGMVKSNAKYSFLKYTIEYLDIDTLFADFQSIPGKDGFWKKYYNELSTYKNNKPYEGTIYVLTGSGEQSSGAEMAFDLYKSGAIIIGEETGGDYYQMNAIHFTDVKLGSTNLLLTLPLMKIIDNTKIDPRIPKNRGLIPHYTIKRTIKSLINDEDNQLEYCIQLIKGQNK